MLYFAHKLHFQDCSKKPLEQAIRALDQYSEGEEGYFPRYILKSKGQKVFAKSVLEASAVISRLKRENGAFHTVEDLVVQPFLLPKGKKARSVRVTWRLSRGYRVQFHENYAEMRERELVGLVTGTEAGVVEAQLSVSTNVLRETADYVRLLVEKAVFGRAKGRLAKVQIQMMQDVNDNWFFLGLESLEATPNLPTLHISRETDPPLYSPRSLPSTNSVRPPSVPLKQDLFTLPKTTSSSTLKPPACHSARAVSRPVFVYPERYRKEQALEAEVSKLLSLDSPKALSNQTYKSWKKRVSEGPRMLLVDRMYAQAICKAKRAVQFESKATLRDLQRFKEAIKAQTEEMVFKAEIEDRFAGKVGGSLEKAEPMTAYSQTSMRKQRKLEQEYRSERAREGIGRVVQDSVDRMTAMTERIRAIKAVQSLDMQ